MLYRQLAPITNEAWDEIDERAEDVLKSYLSARKVVKVNGPKGLDYNVITEGRLENIKEEKDICYGVYQVQPLTEVRIEFEMDRWELDNISRGARDIDYEPLENAMKELALFEENAIYNGLEKAMIKGIDSYSKLGISFGNDPTTIMEAITKGLIQLKKYFEPGPYTLVVNGAYLLPYNHDDLELTIGKDISIGYQEHTAEKVRFFTTESFTFRVLNPDLIVKFNI